MKKLKKKSGVSTVMGTMLAVGIAIVLASSLYIYLSPLYTTRPPPIGLILHVSFQKVPMTIWSWNSEQGITFYAYLLEIEVVAATQVSSLKYVSFDLNDCPIYYLNAKAFGHVFYMPPVPEKNPNVPIKAGETFYIYHYLCLRDDKMYLVMSTTPPPKGGFGIVIPLPASQFTLKVVDLKSNSLLYCSEVAPPEYANWNFTNLMRNSTEEGPGKVPYAFKISYVGGTIDPKWSDLDIYVAGYWPLGVVPAVWTSEVGKNELASSHPIYLHGSPWWKYWITTTPPSEWTYSVPPGYVYIIDKKQDLLIGAYVVGMPFPYIG